MPACLMDLQFAQLLSVPVLYINGPSDFRGSPEYIQQHLEHSEKERKTWMESPYPELKGPDIKA